MKKSNPLGEITFILLLGVLILPIISANWVIPKAKTCEFMNVTGSECDQLWCGIIDCEYNSSVEACTCYQTQEVYTINLTNVTSSFYNKTEMDEMLENINQSIEDKLNESEIVENITKQINSTFKEELLDVKSDLLSKIENNIGTFTTSDDNTPLYFLGGMIILAVFGIFYFNKNRGSGGYSESSSYSGYSRGESPTAYKKIQPMRRLEQEEEIKRLKEALEKEREKGEGE